MREQNIKDLLTLLTVLYKRGPRNLAELHTALDTGDDPVSDAGVADLVDKVAHVNEWLWLA